MSEISQVESKTLIKVGTVGSVDDGKSTLIARLLLDLKEVYQKQLKELHDISKRKGEKEIDLALLLDGLKDEREQKITIDVAYKYFSSQKRRYILADNPGHVQYTRNMLTGASSADVLIIVVDATKGILPQTKRHLFLASLLQVPHLIVAVNKMDLLEYREDAYHAIKEDFNLFSKKLDIDNISFIPVSALKGDNIINQSSNMLWYKGASILYHLENVQVDSTKNKVDFRFPVQTVIRPDQSFRGYAGTVSSGQIREGDEVLALPGKQKSKIKSIHRFEDVPNKALTSQSVVLTLSDELDVGRGDMIVRVNNVPSVSSELEAVLCWLDNSELDPTRNYILMHTSRTSTVSSLKLYYRIDIENLHRENVNTLYCNDIGRVRISLTNEVFTDPYKINRETGKFILIDPVTNNTVAAGFIKGINTADDLSPADSPESRNIAWKEWNISKQQREFRYGHSPKVIWFTGVSGAGKSSLSRELEKKLWSEGKQTMILDGDQLRHGLCSDLGFSVQDRKENIRRVGELAKFLYEHGNIVICAFVSPIKEDRDIVRALLPKEDFVEIYVKCSKDTLMKRDPKGLYEKARKGKITGLTGYDGKYEENINAEIVVETDKVSIEACIKKIFNYLEKL